MTTVLSSLPHSPLAESYLSLKLGNIKRSKRVLGNERHYKDAAVTPSHYDT